MTYEIEFFHFSLFCVKTPVLDTGILYTLVYSFSKLTTWQESIAFAPQTYIVLKSLDPSGL